MKKSIMFVAITFAITWGMQIPAGFMTGAFEGGIGSSLTMQLVVAATMFAPLAGALIANRMLPKEERTDLALRPRIKENVRWYLVAWFIPAALALAGCIVFFVANPALFDPSMTNVFELAQEAGSELPDIEPTVLLMGVVTSAAIFAPFVNMLLAFGEEAGWRGMLYPALRERFAPAPAALISGVIWGIWHAPVIIMGHNYGTGYAGYPWLGILAMVLFCMATGTILAWLREKSGTVWTCSLYHGAVNATANIGLFVCATGLTVFGPSALGLVAGVPTFVFGVWCLLRLNGEKNAC